MKCTAVQTITKDYCVHTFTSEGRETLFLRQAVFYRFVLCILKYRIITVFGGLQIPCFKVQHRYSISPKGTALGKQTDEDPSLALPYLGGKLQ